MVFAVHGHETLCMDADNIKAFVLHLHSAIKVNILFTTSLIGHSEV